MSGGVDQPGHVQRENVTQNSGDVISVQPGLVPEVDWNHGWHDEAQQRHKNQVVPAREHEILGTLSIYFACLIVTA